MRLYSTDDVRGLLPQVVPILEEIRATFLELRALNATISAERRGATADGQLIADPWTGESGTNRVEELGARLRSAIARLDLWGIELKDPERGLVDFYHERDGEVVFLCYMLEDGELGYWHSLAGGFAARRRL